MNLVRLDNRWVINLDNVCEAWIDPVRAQPNVCVRFVGESEKTPRTFYEGMASDLLAALAKHGVSLALNAAEIE